MTKTNFGLTLKNKVLLGCGDFPYTTDNTGKRISAFTAYLKASNVSKTAHISTVNLSHRPTGEVIVKSDVKVQPPMADMLQPPTADGQHPYSMIMPFTPMGEIRICRKGFNISQHSPMTKVKYLQAFTQFEDRLKGVTRFDIGIYQNQTLAFLNIIQCVKLKLNSLLRKYRSEFTNSLLRKTHILGRHLHSYKKERSHAFTPVVDKVNKLKDKKVIAKDRLNNYPSRALSKISRLALEGYHSNGVQSARAFFVRNISMRLHIYVELWGNTSECASDRLSLSSNPLQLRTNHLEVISEAPFKSNGVHTHA